MQRLNTEFMQINKERPYLFYAKKLNEKPTNQTRNHLINKASVIIECGFPGPNTDLYNTAYFRIYILIDDNYPYKPPHAMFLNPVFHPNVYTDGYVCLDILGPSRWKPTMGVIDICKALQHLLINPNNKSPANSAAYSVLSKSKAQYEEQVKKNIKLYHHKKPWDTKN